jgi:signal transduction histidine kinase
VQNIYRRTSPTFAQNRNIAEQHQVDMEKLHGYLQERDIYQFLEDIRAAGERAARIVSNMLEFSHTSNRNPGPIDLKSVLDHSIELSINTEMVKDAKIKLVHIERDYDENLPAVMGSSAELQQVILNLLRNARQALASETYTPPAQPTIRVRAYPEGDCVIIEVIDNGPGMSDEAKNHIFEPFYTTKGVGKGTGQGLYIAHDIVVKKHHGQISVNSSPGKGTTFIIRLPLSQPEVQTVV